MKKLLISIIMVSTFAASSMATESSWEVGVGANYGGLLGITLNNKISDRVEVYGGVALVGAVAGTRFYMTDNIRLNTNYGVQGYIVKEGFGDDEIEILHGFNVGVDYIWDNQFSLGFVYHLTSNVDDKISEARNDGYVIDEEYTGKVKLSLGYRF